MYNHYHVSANLGLNCMQKGNHNIMQLSRLLLATNLTEYIANCYKVEYSVTDLSLLNSISFSYM